MGLEGIVSKRTDAPYRSGPSKVWPKSKNALSEAVAPGARGGVEHLNDQVAPIAHNTLSSVIEAGEMLL